MSNCVNEEDVGRKRKKHWIKLQWFDLIWLIYKCIWDWLKIVGIMINDFDETAASEVSVS